MLDAHPRETPERVEIVGLLALAIAGMLAARLVAHTALGDVPHVMDEMAYDLQARTLAGGTLVLPVREPRAAFALWYVDDRTATFGIFPPGWPAVLALFMKVGLRAWANPFLHGVTTLLVGGLARTLAGKRAGLVAAGAWALAPQTVVLAASLMSHTLVAAAASLVLLVAARMVTGKHCPGWAHMMAGLALGVVVLSRPLCAAVVAGAILVAWALAKRRAYGPTRSATIAFAAPVVIAVAILGAYNHALTGSALRFPQSAYFDGHLPPVDDGFFAFGPGCNDLGFGHGCDRGIHDARHDLANALSNTGDNLTCWVLLSAGGPLAFAAALVAAHRSRDRGVIAMLLVSTPAALLLYGLYWYGGTCFGARFYHAALPGLVVAAALGVATLRTRVFAAVMTLGLAYNAFALSRAHAELSSGYWGTDTRFHTLATRWSNDPALVLVAFRRDQDLPAHYTWTARLRGTWDPPRRLLGALAPNGARFDGKVLFARFHPGLVADLRRRFPSRDPWLYVIDDESGDTLQRLTDTVEMPAPVENFGAHVLEP